jgi:hypothetical protein
MIFRPLRNPGRRAFMMVDLLLAVSIAAAVLLSLSVAVATLHRAQRQMAQQRADARRLEAALFTLQTGGNIDPQCQIERLAANAPPNRAWVRVSLPKNTPGANSGRASLVGLVPADKTPGGAP